MTRLHWLRHCEYQRRRRAWSFQVGPAPSYSTLRVLVGRLCSDPLFEQLALPKILLLTADQGRNSENLGPPPADYTELLAARREGYAPQHLTETGGPQRNKTLPARRSRATCV